MAEIAVIIPFLPTDDATRRTWLDEAVASVQAQTFKDVELHVVEDKAGRGPGWARNQGVKASKAEWIVALDADDRLRPDALEKLYEARCEFEAVYGDLEWIGLRKGYQRLFDYDWRHLRALTGPLPVTALHNRKAWRVINGWNEHLDGLEDIEYWIRLAEIGICGKHIDATILEYRQHAGSRTASLEANERQKLAAVRLEIQDKHRAFFGGIQMACASCPGGGQPIDNSVTQPDGTVELRYDGRMQGSFMVDGPSGERYRVEGRGAQVFVKPADVDYLLNLRRAGESEYLRVVREAAPEVAAPALFAALPELETAETDITTMNVKTAIDLISKTADVPDLRIYLAQEKAVDLPRVTVTKAIEKRLTVLLDGAAA